MSGENEKHSESLRSLIEAVVNGEASADQQKELEQRLLDDEQARDAWLNYINLHATLNRWFLASDSALSLDEDVEEPHRTMKTSNRKPHRLRYGLIGLIALSLVVVVCVSLWPWFRLSEETPLAEGPTIVKLSGPIQIQSADGQTMAATDHQVLHPGQTVISSGDNDRVVLRYPDGTELVLLGTLTLTIGDSPTGGKHLHLKKGLLEADVAPQPPQSPLWIVTSQARVQVLGTQFELSTDEQAGTRLDLVSGQVELVRGEGPPVKVEPNSIAIVPTTPDPIRISPRPAVIDTPQREMVFQGLKSIAFAEDGKTIIGGTRWQALYWFADDRLEVIPLSSRGRHGISLRKQKGSLLTYFDHEQQKLVLWDARTRQPQVVFEDIAGMKRQFRDFAKRPPSWNPAASVATVSPDGDCLAFQVGREFRLWRAETDHWPNFVKNYDGRFVGALALSPNGETLAVAVRRGKVDLVEVKSGEVITTWSLKGEVPFAMEYSRNGECLAVGLAGRVRVHDVASGGVLADFDQPGLPFLQVAVSADGRFVAASSLGNRVWVWDVMARAELPLLDIGESIQDLTFAPSGNHLAVLSRGGRVTLWEVTKPEPQN